MPIFCYRTHVEAYFLAECIYELLFVVWVGLLVVSWRGNKTEGGIKYYFISSILEATLWYYYMCKLCGVFLFWLLSIIFYYGKITKRCCIFMFQLCATAETRSKLLILFCITKDNFHMKSLAFAFSAYLRKLS